METVAAVLMLAVVVLFVGIGLDAAGISVFFWHHPKPTIVAVNQTLAPSVTRQGGPMSELDVAREKVAYLKFWLGVVVVTDISVTGWLITSTASSTPANLAIVLAVAGMIILTLVAWQLHRRIERRIDEMRTL